MHAMKILQQLNGDPWMSGCSHAENDETSHLSRVRTYKMVWYDSHSSYMVKFTIFKKLLKIFITIFK